MIRSTSLAALLFLPVPALAGDVFHESTAGNATGTLSLSATMQGSVTLSIDTRDANRVTITDTANTGTITLGAVSLADNWTPGNGQGNRFLHADGSGIFVAPLRLALTTTGYDGANVTIEGGTNDLVADPDADARWDCAAVGGLMDWTVADPGTVLSQTPGTCSTFAGTAPLSESLDVDLALHLQPTAPAATYTADFVFTVVPQ